MFIFNQLRWVSSIDPDQHGEIEKLQEKMGAFYTNNASYFEEINFTAENWSNPEQPHYRKIVEMARTHHAIEVGCGRANLLSAFPDMAERYTGVDFSETLVAQNRARHPSATFACFSQPNCFPFADHSFDLVFSVFVIEHSADPRAFLRESLRLLRPGGCFALLCPDFLGKGRMSSQKVGLTRGTGREKWIKRHYLDAILTGIESKLLIPAAAWWCRMQARHYPRFYVNLEPTCFAGYSFQPDVDAVYLTYAREIKMFLQPAMRFDENPTELATRLTEAKAILISGTKTTDLRTDGEYFGD